jgi:hypothetical protein
VERKEAAALLLVPGDCPLDQGEAIVVTRRDGREALELVDLGQQVVVRRQITQELASLALGGAVTVTSAEVCGPAGRPDGSLLR